MGNSFKVEANFASSSVQLNFWISDVSDNDAVCFAAFLGHLSWNLPKR